MRRRSRGVPGTGGTLQANRQEEAERRRRRRKSRRKRRCRRTGTDANLRCPARIVHEEEEEEEGPGEPDACEDAKCNSANAAALAM